MRSIKQQARVAGLFYFLLALTAPIGLLYVPGRLVVSGDAAATADRIRAAEGLFRIGVASELFHQVVGIFLVLALYRLFRTVNEGLAAQVVILGALVSVPVMFANALNEVAALVLLRGPTFLAMFDRAQLDGLAYLFVRLHGDGIGLVLVFWGLWLFPFGVLVLRSGFIPRVLGVLLIVAGISHLASAGATVLAPQLESITGPVSMILGMGELPIIFWLLIWGARGPAADAPVT